MDFLKLPNSIIGYDFDTNVLNLLQFDDIEKRGYKAREGFHFSSLLHNRLFFEIVNNDNFELLYNGSFYTLFYTIYRECVFWGKDDGKIVKANISYRSCDSTYLGSYMVGYGKEAIF